MTLSTWGTRESGLTRWGDFAKLMWTTGQHSHLNLKLTQSRRNVTSRKATVESISKAFPNETDDEIENDLENDEPGEIKAPNTLTRTTSSSMKLITTILKNN